MLWKIKLKTLISYLIYNIILLTVAYFLDRFFQMLIFILFFNAIQNCFNYRFHADTIVKDPIKAVKWCKVITIVVEIIYMILCKNLDVSVYSNLFIIFFIAFVNCILEFALQSFFIKKKCLKNKDELLKLCTDANLTYNATNRLIMKYIDNKTYKEIAIIEHVDEDTIKKSISRSKIKLFKDQD